MKKFIAPALLTLVAMCSQAYAQSRAGADTDTSSAGTRSSTGEQTDSASSDRSSGQSSASGASGQSGATGSTTAGQASRTGATSRSQGSQAGQSGGQAQGSPIDQHIAVCLTLGNQEEIALSQFGQDRAQNPQVKQFAQMMVQEHQQAISQLQQAAPQLASMNLELTAAGAGERSGAASTSGASGAASGSASGAGSPSGLAGTNGAGSTSGSQRASAGGSQAGQGSQQQLVDFARDTKQQCVSLAMQELGRKQGAEFDKAFMGQQIALHTSMLAQLRAAQQHSQNDQLKPIIQQGTQMTEHHLAQARQIMEQLDAADGAEGATRQGAATPAVPRR